MRAHRESWMNRHNVSFVDLALIVGVGGGLASSVLAPSRVATVVELSDWSAAHGPLLILLVSAISAVLAGRFARTWGPVRASAEAARWRLSGPGGRARELGRSLVIVSLGSVAGVLLLHGALALLMPDRAVAVLGAGVVAGVLAVAAAYAAQVVVDRRIGVPDSAGLSPGSLHRRTFAPRDGFAGAVGLAVSMMDASWIDDARVTRWQRRRTCAAGGVGGSSVFAAFVRADARRLRRHPEALARWGAWTAIGVLCPLALQFHHAVMLVPVVAAWMAGNAATGGLRSSANPVLRRGFGSSDGLVRAAHCVVPVIASAVSGLAVAVASGTGAVAGAVIVTGVVGAVLRRATRPPLPFDSPVVTEGLLTGAAFQPALITAQLRGPILAVMTAVVAGTRG